MSFAFFPSHPIVEATYTSLPNSLFQFTKPTPVSSPKVLFWNEELAREFQFEDWTNEKEATALFFFWDIIT